MPFVTVLADGETYTEADDSMIFWFKEGTDPEIVEEEIIGSDFPDVWILEDANKDELIIRVYNPKVRIFDGGGREMK